MAKQARVSSLEAHLGYWLRFVSNHVSHGFRARLEAREVTVAEWVVLRDLYDRDETAPSALAERIGMTRGAISKLSDRLLEKELVRRTHSEHDRRFQALALTAAGRALVPRLAALADENDEAFFGHMTPKERSALEHMLKDLVRRHGLRSAPTD